MEFDMILTPNPNMDNPNNRLTRFRHSCSKPRLMSELIRNIPVDEDQTNVLEAHQKQVDDAVARIFNQNWAIEE